MRELKRAAGLFLKGADLILLFLGLAASVFGAVVIASAARTEPRGSASFVRTQAAGVVLGVIIFVLLTIVDLDFLVKFWKWILGFNILLMLLIIPFGQSSGGNTSWIFIPGLPMGIQPSEVVKVTFTLLMAAQVWHFREKPSGIIPVTGYVAHLGLMFALNYFLSRDVGVGLIYVASFLFIMLGAGIKLRWFALGGVAVTAASPFLWRVMPDFMQSRIMVLINPSMDPKTAWQQQLSVEMIGGGGPWGQGLFKGRITQTGQMYAQHNDFIFSSLGEELGFIGCMGCILLLSAIILRCLWIARRAKNGLGMMVCCGVAGMFIFQTFLNIGMCLFLAPVVGITLPFFSYGGSSMMASFAALGLVSSVRMHPERTWLDT